MLPDDFSGKKDKKDMNTKKNNKGKNTAKNKAAKPQSLEDLSSEEEEHQDWPERDAFDDRQRGSSGGSDVGRRGVGGKGGGDGRSKGVGTGSSDWYQESKVNVVQHQHEHLQPHKYDPKLGIYSSRKEVSHKSEYIYICIDISSIDIDILFKQALINNAFLIILIQEISICIYK